MSDIRQKTVDTYNKSAKELAEYFRGIGPRELYIRFGLKLANNPKKPRVLEIGCGDGRDAKEILKYADWYEGFDISTALIDLAKEKVPEASFKVGDAVTYDYPGNLDVVYAFASLLHLDEQEVKQVLGKVHTALRPGGIFYISLKAAPEYSKKIKEDKFGTRVFYLYTPELITELAGRNYEVALICRETIGNTKWFEVALKKYLP